MSQQTSLLDKVKGVISHGGFRKYLLNTGWVFGEKILRLVAGLFVGAYVARYLGPSQYGILNYVISLVALFSVFADIGFEAYLVREIVRNEDKKNYLLGTAFAMKACCAPLVFTVLYVIIRMSNTDEQTATLVTIIALGMFFETFKVIDYFFQSRVLSRYTVYSQMLGLSFVSVFRLILVFNDAPLVWFAWSYVLDLGIYALGLIFFYSKNHNFFSWRFDRHLAVSLLRQSWPMLVASLSIVVYMKVDQLMIKWMLNDEANGYYGVAIRLCELWNFVPMAICSSLFPAILRSKMTDETLYLKRLQSLYDLMVFISVGIAVPMTFLSPFIVRILFGEAYAAASGIMSIYIWSAVFVFLGIANGRWLLTENLQVFRMRNFILAAIMNVLLNLVLIPLIGLEGAAISTLISQAFSGYFSFLISKKTRPGFRQLSRSLNLFIMPKRLLSDLRDFGRNP